MMNNFEGEQVPDVGDLVVKGKTLLRYLLK